MIVDDSPVMRSFVRRTLEIAGLEIASCAEAGDGREALVRLAEDPVDLILTDINMPGMDGMRLIAAVKRNPETAPIPVIVVSTDSTEQRVGDLMRLGANGYVRKPFAPERLRQVVVSVVPDWEAAGGGKGWAQ